jgi:hypothetical protein
MYVYMYVFMYQGMYESTFDVSMHTYKNTHIRTLCGIRLPVYRTSGGPHHRVMDTYIHTHSIHTYTQGNGFIHTYIHTYMHTYIHSGTSLPVFGTSGVHHHRVMDMLSMHQCQGDHWGSNARHLEGQVK